MLNTSLGFTSESVAEMDSDLLTCSWPFPGSSCSWCKASHWQERALGRLTQRHQDVNDVPLHWRMTATLTHQLTIPKKGISEGNNHLILTWQSSGFKTITREACLDQRRAGASAHWLTRAHCIFWAPHFSGISLMTWKWPQDRYLHYGDQSIPPKATSTSTSPNRSPYLWGKRNKPS